MSIRKLSRTAGTRKEMSAEEWEQILNSIETFGMKPLSSDQLQQLQYKENCYPVIPVPNKFLLLAVHSTRFTGLVWLSNWFLVDSTYRDKYNEYHVRLSVNGSLVDVDYDLLYPKEVTKISKYGLIFNFDHADAFSRYLFRCITKLEIEEQYCGMGFMMKEKKLQFMAYEEGAKILQYSKDVPMEVYTEGLNRLLTNTAVMFALCCSCASLFLAYLSIQCGMALQSFIISFYGRTTTGKSTAQALMASVFTNPSDKKIYVPFFGTLNAIVRNFAQKFGIPQIFDEATVSSGVNMENLFYTVTLEQDKSRCNTNADLRESDTWKLIMITSSECRLLTDAHMHNKGLDARLLSFELAFTDSREHNEKIHDFCGKQYGILGKMLSEYLLKAEPETIQAKYEECRTAMRDAIAETEHFDLTERLINEYALLLLAAMVLSDHGVAMDVEGITAILTENHGSIREKTNVADKYYQHLVTYAAMHPYQEGIDEVFIDVAGYLKTYHCTPQELARKMIREVLQETGITATAGIGTNLYLAKIAMDIVAKKIPADENGVRIAELDEMSYREKLWSHTPLTDFWRIGTGYARRLEKMQIFTMGDLARFSEHGEDLLFRMFGVAAELLIDHAWGYEPCTMQAIKSYQPKGHSISQGQVLPCPYDFEKGRLIVREMTELLVLDLVRKKMVADQIVLMVGYDHTGIPETYRGELKKDRYGKKIPKAAHGSVNLGKQTSSTKRIMEKVLSLYDQIVDPELQVRRMSITANHVIPEGEVQEEVMQYSLFDDVEAQEQKRKQEQESLKKEHQLQEAILSIKDRYGKNAILKGMNFREGATTIERNEQVGGHKA